MLQEIEREFFHETAKSYVANDRHDNANNCFNDVLLYKIMFEIELGLIHEWLLSTNTFSRKRYWKNANGMFKMISKFKGKQKAKNISQHATLSFGKSVGTRRQKKYLQIKNRKEISSRIRHGKTKYNSNIPSVFQADCELEITRHFVQWSRFCRCRRYREICHETIRVHMQYFHATVLCTARCSISEKTPSLVPLIVK